MERKNSILILAGPSGGGKTAVASAILESDPRFTLIRSGTTRAPRGDGHDAEYLYYTEEEFFALIEAGELAEYTNYGGGKLYGTPHSELRRALSEGRIPLLVLDLNGVKSFASLGEYSSCVLYVHASLDTVEKRLSSRYLSEGVTEEGLRSLRTRAEQNINDYLGICEYAPYIFSFIENEGSLLECRDKALALFESFRDGAPVDLAVRTAVVSALTREGRIKKRD